MENNQEKVWDEIAKDWNRFREVPSPSVAKFLEDKKGLLLDLGCGSGRNFSSVNKNTKIYGVDFSENMLNFAKKKAETLSKDLVVLKSYSDNILLNDNYFDSAICASLLHCIEDREKRIATISEIFRLLKSGSQAFISVWGKNSPRLKNKPKNCFVSWTTKNNKQERFTYIYDLDELKKEVEDAGFIIDNIWEERNINVICHKP